MENQGIMALAPGMQAPTAQPMGMPIDPAAEAAFNQARSQISPKEFSTELLNSAEQADPAAVQQLRQALQRIQLPQEVIDAMQQMVEIILRDPQNYAQIRQQMIADGVPENLLPETFDAEFFAALRVALDQIESSSAQPVQAFAKGGIANLRPIASAMQQMGRGQDTLLAHITPQEARMLQRAGGIATMNPMTGLPEYGFFSSIGKAFKSVGKAISGVVNGVVDAVKSFAKSTVGKIVLSVALGFFLGPAAASFLGVTSAAGVAAVSGFVGGFGSSILAGQNFKDALKSGVIGGLSAGATAGVTGGMNAFEAGSYTGPTTVSGQWDKATESFNSLLGKPTAGDVTGTLDGTTGGTTVPTPNQPGVTTPSDITAINPTGPTPAPTAAPSPVQAPPTTSLLPTAEPYNYIDSSTVVPPAGPAANSIIPPTEGGGFYEDYLKKPVDWAYDKLSPSAIAEKGQVAADEAFNTTYKKVYESTLALPGQTPQTAGAAAMKAATAAQTSATPGFFSKYAPLAAVGTGAAYLAGAFTPEPVVSPGIIPKETGTDLLRKYPEIYGTAPGGASMSYAPTSTASFNPNIYQRPTIKLTPPQYPTYLANQYDYFGNPIPAQYAEGGEATTGPDYERKIAQLEAQKAEKMAQFADKNPGAEHFAEIWDRKIEHWKQKQAEAEARNNPPVTSPVEPPPVMPSPVEPPPVVPPPVAPPPVAPPPTPDPTQPYSGTPTPIYEQPQSPYLAPVEVPQPTLVPPPTDVGGTTPYSNLSSSLYPYYSTTSYASNQPQQPYYFPYVYYPQLMQPLTFRNGGIASLGVKGYAEGGSTPNAFMTRFMQAFKPFFERFMKNKQGNASRSVTPVQFTPGGARTVPIQEQKNTAGMAMERPGYAAGGISSFPRRNGPINGPGTGTSDSIPAMLSDGEFVMTAKAVRGMGGGSRREGARRMYQMMHKLERKA